ncbi:hypothetical protein H7I87_18545 [Mycobacterium timonense]|uniref:Uncharacterized protein n=1 Tax=Mycobacterium bouchedurhonense TaxID=701041 RepID=A0AAW5S2U4_MYCBC|nr:hypothetical protein [Mycobacterium bouchedurhonense]MCV6996678.1 hypothetical protein [Mycobacterium timonense]
MHPFGRDDRACTGEIARS